MIVQIIVLSCCEQISKCFCFLRKHTWKQIIVLSRCEKISWWLLTECVMQNAFTFHVYIILGIYFTLNHIGITTPELIPSVMGHEHSSTTKDDGSDSVHATHLRELPWPPPMDSSRTPLPNVNELGSLVINTFITSDAGVAARYFVTNLSTAEAPKIRGRSGGTLTERTPQEWATFLASKPCMTLPRKDIVGLASALLHGRAVESQLFACIVVLHAFNVAPASFAKTVGIQRVWLSAEYRFCIRELARLYIQSSRALCGRHWGSETRYLGAGAWGVRHACVCVCL